MNFRDIVLNEKIENIEKAFGDNLLPFLDALQFYIDYNDEQSKTEILSFKSELKKAGYITKPKSIFRMVRLQKNEVNKKQKKRLLTSASTVKMKGKMIEFMKSMINQYKIKGDYYYQEIKDAEGFDINSFAKDFLPNKTMLLNKYNQSKIMSFFFDTIENKKDQEEFLIFGDYFIFNMEPI